MIYFIQNKSSGAVKIGTAINPVKRLAILQTGSVDSLVLLGTIPGNRDREAELHRRFRHLRIRSEWFQDTKELMEAIDSYLSEGMVSIDETIECNYFVILNWLEDHFDRPVERPGIVLEADLYTKARERNFDLRTMDLCLSHLPVEGFLVTKGWPDGPAEYAYRRTDWDHYQE